MAIFPQINSNCIITQYPYNGGFSYDNPKVDVETGMRWSFPRRGNLTLPTDYAPGPLSRFQLSYTMITDAEVASLYSFLQGMRGKWGSFGFLDPGGNLLQYSEDFTQAYWTKTVVSVGSAVTDPFGGNLATALTSSSSNGYITAVIGPSGGGLLNYVLNASAWVRATGGGQTICIGFLDSTGSGYSVKTYQLPNGSWVRISWNVQMWSSNYFRFILGGENTWGSGATIDVFGCQVAPTKGEGAYVRTSGPMGPSYGWHPNCRFDVDMIMRTSLGPNQNQLELLVQEHN